MSEKLKPCPFCGEEAEFYENINGRWIHCPKCDVWSARISPKFEEQAVHQWNTRPEMYTGLKMYGIKHCPICGSWTVAYYFNENIMHCRSCGLDLHAGVLHTMEDAIEAWNRRA